MQDGMRVKDWKVHVWKCKTAGSTYTTIGGQSLAEHSGGIRLPSKKYKKKNIFSHNLVASLISLELQTQYSSPCLARDRRVEMIFMKYNNLLQPEDQKDTLQKEAKVEQTLNSD